MLNAKPVSVPLASHFKLSSSESPSSNEDEEFMSPIPYANADWSIIYDMVCTLSDIVQAVSVVSKGF